MSRLRSTIATAGAAVLLVLTGFSAGAATAPAAPSRAAIEVRLDAPDPDDESRDETSDVGVNAVPGLGQAELLYVPITPCRVVSSLAGTGTLGNPLGNGTGRTYYIAGTTGFPAQGGTSGGCGIPTSAMAVSAMMLAYQPSQPGRLRTWPAANTEPAASAMYYGSETLGVGVTLALTNGPGKDLKVRNSNATTDLVIDVTGYYVPQLYAYISPGGTIIDQSGRLVSAVQTETGSYTLTWDRSVDTCVGVGSSDLTGYIVSVYTSGSTSYVYLDNNAGAAADYWFNVSLHC